MSRTRSVAVLATAFATALAVFAASLPSAQDTDLKTVIRKAIAAHGGEKEIGKYNAAVSKYKGTMKLMGMNVDVTGENSFQKPDKLRVATTLEIAGKSINILTVFDGKTLWVSAGGNTK